MLQDALIRSEGLIPCDDLNHGLIGVALDPSALALAFLPYFAVPILDGLFPLLLLLLLLYELLMLAVDSGLQMAAEVVVVALV